MRCQLTISVDKVILYFKIQGQLGETGNQGSPGKQGAAGEPGKYIPELDEIIEGNIGIQGDLGLFSLKLIET